MFNIKLSPFAISNLLIALTCLPLTTVSLIYGRTRLSRVYSLHTISIGVWGFFGFLAVVNDNYQASLLLWKIAYCGVIFIPIFFLHVISLITYNLKKMLLFTYSLGIFLMILVLKGYVLKNVKYMFNSMYYAQGELLLLISFVTWIFLALFEHYILIKYYCKNKDRQNLILILAMMCGFGGGVMNFLPGFNINIYPWTNFLIPFYVVIMSYAIFKYQILDIQLIVQKGVVYSVLVTLISVSYLIFVLITEKLFQGMIGYRSLFISTLYALIIAIFFNPIKNKIQHLADRVFLGKDPIQIAQENELLKQEIEKADRLKAVAAFASGMAHEIKNPLTAIKTFSEYLPQKLNDPQFLHKFSNIVNKEVSRIDNLVHQLLEFSRPAPLKIEEADIHKLLDDTLELLSSDLLKHNIKVIKHYADYNLLARIDPNKMKQAFLNLFLNAIEAMPFGGTLSVCASIRENQRGEKSAEICVQDTGCGISEKDLAHIFEPFHSTKEGGTGLGLSITYGIIKEHKGSIRVESELNKCTFFFVELPIVF